MPSPEWTYKHATDLRDHWWWRPGWQVGTRFYTWHITFDGQHELHRLVDTYQAELARHPGLDLIPHQWLHLTMQGVGHAADITTDQIDSLLSAAQARLAALNPVTVEFHRPVIRPEAIVLPALPPAEVDRIRTAVRASIADVLGPDAVPDQADGFQPHVTLAYSSSAQSADTIESAIESISSEPVEVSIPTASLIELHRDNRMYEWHTIAEVPIDSQANGAL
ncbi:2'-5' RNA ligase family protein [Kribbella antibiotica]|uniref:2'-5' RNA ligase family protein n=1 Tax=Kribbella antibiotica TaxID=190195 RepID=A0A4R4ZIR5_9ACTN|nr:2'-5' RNA ligase family protein [Kribbella antibiotica]TDD58020.1 2'-5' RNA ligase family protein [Kribbella antibiotica]